jgi:hypothetical protein
MLTSGRFIAVNKIIAMALMAVLVTDGASILLSRVFSDLVTKVEASVVTIDSAPSTDAPSHTVMGTNVVFIDDQTGYVFFRSSDGRCRYRKTTDSGVSWAASVIVDNQTDCIGVTVWYDRWTPGDTGQMVHIATMDTSDDHIFYNRLDTANDSLLLTTSTSTTLGSPATYTSAANRHSITKSTNGVLYVVADDQQGSVIRSCSTNCGISTNWSAVGTPPQGNANSLSLLRPLASGNILLINRSTGNVLRSSFWNGATWSSFTTIDSTAVQNTTYDVGFAATVDITNNDIYLAYVADNDSFTVADHDIRTAVYSGGTWTSKPDIITNHPTRGLLQIAIGRDLNNGDIHVAFTARTTINSVSTANVYSYRSTDGMTTWGSEVGPINSTPGNFYGIGMNLMSVDRLYLAWYDNETATRAIYGATIANIGPEVRLSGQGSAIGTVRDGTIDNYLGGTFFLESVATRTVSTFTVSEIGTVDAQTKLSNLKLYYDTDTSTPFNCGSESFSNGQPPSEAQFGSTISGGFTGPNGVAVFTASPPVTVGPSRSLCFYMVADISESALDGETVKFIVNNPSVDVVMSDATEVFPPDPVMYSGTTTIVSPDLTQSGYHWRNDDGNEANASSATAGNPNTSLSTIAEGQPIRLRLAVSNQGSTTSLPTTFTLETASPSPTCELATGWARVGTPESSWDMYNSPNLTHGQNTTNIATSTGGVIDPKTNFVSPNLGVRTLSASTTAQTIGVDGFVELEFSLQASTTAIEGESYCFRLVKDNGSLQSYAEYPIATIIADVTVDVFGIHRATTTINASGVLQGGGFAVIENTGTHTITEITLTEIGTIDADALNSLRLRYRFDTTAPYDCSGVLFDGSEPLFGSAGTLDPITKRITFSGSSPISLTSTLCVMVEYDVGAGVVNGQTIQFSIASPALDVVASGGASVGPSGSVSVSSSTVLQVGTLVQTAYHWRNNNGTEADATSATGGTPNTPLNDFLLESPIRLRLAVANTNLLASSAPVRFRLEYAPKVTTCDIATVWSDVGVALDAFDMFNSAFLTNGSNTTNIAPSIGGVADPQSNFLSPNGGVRDTESLTGTTTLGIDDFIELEFSITSTDYTSYNTSYCFRVSANGTPLSAYNSYPELTTAPKRDFKVQRGSATVSGTSTTLVAGTDYIAPASTSSAFVRITNSHYTGAGHNTGNNSAQNVRDVTARIMVNDIRSDFSVVRALAAGSNTRVDWEIIEFIGPPNTDNEIIVRSVQSLNFTSTAVRATGTPVTTVQDDSKVVVFITGVSNNNDARNYYAGQVTAEWDPVTKSPVFRRGNAGSSVIDVSYAVVEFVGINWRIQRVEHAYSVPGDFETEDIEPVNSLARAFLHVQKRMGATTNVVHFGHEVWLSSIGKVTFRIEPLASVAVEQTSVAWVIENTQIGVGAMSVERTGGTTNGGGTPFTLSVSLLNSVALSNASLMGNTTMAQGANTTYPRPLAGFILTNSNTYQIYRSNSGSEMTYRATIVSWPVADLSLRQDYYRFYTNNDALTPTDPWPPGVVDIGENTSITVNDYPVGPGDRVRLRMTIRVINASLPAGQHDFKLQYGLRATTCSAIGVSGWVDVGTAASSTIWRGFTSSSTTNGQSLSTNPPNPSDLLVSVSDRAGSLVHSNPSPLNPFAAAEGDHVEYDWHVEHNGADPKSVYCFRIIKGDGNLLEGYNLYPQIRTAAFTPANRSWRWYSDANNETPALALAGENITPIDIKNDDVLMLRVTVGELRNITDTNIKYRLQFSEDSTFASFQNVAATSSCGVLSYWCYAEGGGVDGDLISSSTLSDAASCVSGSGPGCGRHNTTPTTPSSHTHPGNSNQEFSFTIRHTGARVSAIYYFRLYDVTNDEPVTVAPSSSLPTLITEGPTLSFGVAGVPVGSSTAGVVVTIEASPTAIAFGDLQFNNEEIAAYRLSVTTNATEGYQILKYARQPLMSSKGPSIPSITSTNASPGSWVDTCQLSTTTTGCIGYHTTDSTLSGGSTRFGINDSYAGLSTSPEEVMYSSVPASDTHDIVYRIVVNELQPAGNYETEIVFLGLPAY